MDDVSALVLQVWNAFDDENDEELEKEVFKKFGAAYVIIDEAGKIGFKECFSIVIKIFDKDHILIITKEEFFNKFTEYMHIKAK